LPFPAAQRNWPAAETLVDGRISQRNLDFGSPDWRMIEASVFGLTSSERLCAATVTIRTSPFTTPR
jgi:hypothetical protein